ncbi:unnamed protein product [Schistosoma curassoni]|uniref:Cleavage and polyadenylation specificity factor subunit 6 n=1 Tax=Schistosoma curassoni TaxID=6186 RepID=A0A183KES7_9TREM|nr:unnamed protein product [Schistosoma curassoni]VDP53031.1 unnamed protein product [Schistosoma curassoni]
MAGDNTEIDLYDNIDEDFVQECTDLTELYDDVIAPIKSENSSGVPSMASKHSYSSSAPPGRRVSVYVGNLTWWTTDLDLLEAASGIGINDVIEIKFHENRQNGQSKGFCVMVFGSEQSMRLAMDKFPKIDLHGQNPVVTSYTKHNLSVFEKAAGSDNQATARPRTEEMQTMKVSGAGTTGVLGNRLPPPLMATPTMPASLGFSVRNNSPLMGQVVPNVRNAANLSSSIQQALANHNAHSGLGGNSNVNQLPLNFPGSTGVLMPPSGMSTATLAANATGLLPSNFTLPSTIATSIATNAHVNPNFLTQQVPGNPPMLPNSLPPGVMQLPTQNNDSNVRPQFDHYGRPVIHTYTPPVPGKLSESEFEDILQRNKTVSSSAINRAVQDAAGGDYASAIETLVTAISLIKQSKIANDDRCRILINSLQDTLHGIESKSYGAKSSSRRRRRSYSDSGSDGGEGNYNSSISGSGNNNSRRHRDRNHRSRSRDRHDRHERHDRRRHSRERGSGSGNTYYGIGSSLPLPSGSGLSGIQSVDGSGQTCAGNLGSSADRYRDSRYRH